MQHRRYCPLMRLIQSPFSLLDNLPPNTRGAAWMLIATVLFGLMTACIGVAVAANLFQVALTNAYKGVEATAIMPFDFARLPFVALAAFIVLGQRPDVWTRVGGAVIFAATVYIARREALIAHNQQSREEEILKDQAG